MDTIVYTIIIVLFGPAAAYRLYRWISFTMGLATDATTSWWAAGKPAAEAFQRRREAGPDYSIAYGLICLGLGLMGLAWKAYVG